MMLFHRNGSVWFKMKSRLRRSRFVVLGQVRAVRLEGCGRCGAPVKSSYTLLLQLSRQADSPIDRFVNCIIWFGLFNCHEVQKRTLGRLSFLPFLFLVLFVLLIWGHPFSTLLAPLSCFEPGCMATAHKDSHKDHDYDHHGTCDYGNHDGQIVLILVGLAAVPYVPVQWGLHSPADQVIDIRGISSCVVHVEKNQHKCVQRLWVPKITDVDHQTVQTDISRRRFFPPE